MFNIRKLLSGLLILALLCACLSGCGKTAEDAAATPAEPSAAAEETAPQPEQEPAEAPSEPSAQESAPEIAEPTEAPAEQPEPIEADEPAEALNYTLETAIEASKPYSYTLPLVDELTTFSVYTQSAPDFIKPFLGADQCYSSAPSNVYIGEKTNVQLEYIEISAAAYTEQFNLMIASGNYSDLFSSLSDYTDVEAYNDEVILEMTKYVEENMPAHWAVVEAAGLTADMYNEAGQILNVPGVGIGSTAPSGLIIRQDWLDAQGLEMPNTYTELHDVALALKNAYNLPYAIFMLDSMNAGTSFSAGYDLPNFDISTAGSHLFIVDGQYESAYVREDFRNYLIMIRDWINEGLINRDFYTLDDTGKDQFLGGDVAVYWDKADYITENNARTDTEPGFNAQAGPFTLQEEGQVLHFSGGQELSISGGIYVTTECHDLDLAVQFLDWMFTEDGIMLSNYGMEADSAASTEGSFYYDDNGEIQWTEYMVNNPNGYPFRMVTSSFISSTLPSVVWNHATDGVVYDADGLRAVELWTTGYDCDGAWDFYHTLYSTDEELEEYNKYINDVDTYAEEYILKMVLGQEQVETYWDTFVETLYGFGLQEAIDAKQQALNRYIDKYGLD